MSEKLTIHSPKGKPIYNIRIEKDFEGLAAAVREAGLSGDRPRRVCIAADSTTSGLYAEAVRSCLLKVCSEVFLFVFPAGEKYKTLDTVKNFYAFLIENKFERRDFLAALGGGVVGDLTGFTAATYLRGISFIQIPTTLLAQSDSSVGGKTGVDFDGYKNMVGAFCMPKLVYMNVSVLKTMDRRSYLSGMGEVIKHGWIRDPEFSSYMEGHTQEILSCDPKVLMKLAYRNCQIKGSVVEEDPEEKGLRAILNFGHTLGHAIEKQRADTLYHGECVSVGMIAAAYISFMKGFLTKEDIGHMKEVLTGFNLPTEADFDAEKALESTKNDKKMQNGKIRFILLKSLGEAVICTDVTWEEMKEALLFVRRKS